MGEAKRRKNTLAGAIEMEIAPLPVDPDEMPRREKIKAELRRLIDVVDAGCFEAMIVTELVDVDGVPKMMTNMVGELHVIQASAANIVMHYSEKKGMKQAMADGKMPLSMIPAG